jgi:hypothetical protein
MSSVWIVERVYILSKPMPLAMVPFKDESMAESEAARLRKMFGGDYQVAEYRRVDP